MVLRKEVSLTFHHFKLFLGYIAARAYHKQLIGARTQGRENISRVNRFGNWGINKIFNLFFGTNLTDVCSGLYMLETSFAKEIPFTTEGF